MAEGKKVKKTSLTFKILVALVLGLAIGFLLPERFVEQYSTLLVLPGKLFIKLLKMMILPLVFSSIFLAMARLGAKGELKALTLNSFVFYLSSTVVACLIAVSMGAFFAPGGAHLNEKASLSSSSELPQKKINKTTQETLAELISEMVPSNIFKAATDNRMLQVIFFALMFGVMALLKSEKVTVLTEAVAGLEILTHTGIDVIMRVAPLGVFSLAMGLTSKLGVNMLVALGHFVALTIFCLLLHSGVLLTALQFLGKKNPVRFLGHISRALLTGFSTSSSAATLPVSMEAMVERVKVRPTVARFVLPFGATVNMDGTAIYVSLSALFIAQVYGITLGLTDYAIIVMTASLASIGTAAVPGGSFVTMGIVLSSVGIPMQGIELIVAVDRVLDMCRTSVNVLGDCTGTAIINQRTLRSEF